DRSGGPRGEEGPRHDGGRVGAGARRPGRRKTHLAQRGAGLHPRARRAEGAGLREDRRRRRAELVPVRAAKTVGAAQGGRQPVDPAPLPPLPSLPPCFCSIFTLRTPSGAPMAKLVASAVLIVIAFSLLLSAATVRSQRPGPIPNPLRYAGYAPRIADLLVAARSAMA